jgi:hypothetical protein
MLLPAVRAPAFPFGQVKRITDEARLGLAKTFLLVGAAIKVRWVGIGIAASSHIGLGISSYFGMISDLS